MSNLERLRSLSEAPKRPSKAVVRSQDMVRALAQRANAFDRTFHGGWASGDETDPRRSVDPADRHWSGPGFHPERPPPDSPEPLSKFITVRGIVARDRNGNAIFGSVKVDRDVFAHWQRQHGSNQPYEPQDVAKKAPIAPSSDVRSAGLGHQFKLLDQCPSGYQFVIKFDGRPWPGQVIAMSVVKHVVYSDADIQQWLTEIMQQHRARGGMNAKARSYMKSPMSIPYREFTSEGMFGPAIKNYGCADIVKVFDEMAAFVKMVERNAVPAIQFMKDMKGQLVQSGELRWTFMKHLG